MFRWMSSALAVLLCITIGRGDDPKTAPQGTPSFASTSELVLVPVVVTDPKGAHVRGLTKDVFRLSDNGHAQDVSVFEEVNAEGSSLQLAKTRNGIFTNQVTSGQPATTLTILLLDALNTSGIDQSFSIRAGLEVIRRWQQNRGLKQPILVAVLTPAGLKIVHEATTDPSVLIAALRRLTVMPAANEASASGTVNVAALPDNTTPITPPRQNKETDTAYQARVQQAQMEFRVLDQLTRSDVRVSQAAQDQSAYTTYWALQGIANAVAGLPGRKALIWTASSFPFELHASDPGSPQWANVWRGTSASSADLNDLRTAVLRDLNRSEVSVYPVLASGLLISPEFSAAWENNLANRPRIAGAQVAQRVQPSTAELGARLIAHETAGRSCVNMNDIADCIERAVDDAGHYYLLAFHPKSKAGDHSWHRLKVEVQAPHVSVRARDSYYYGSDPELRRSAKEATDFAARSNLEFMGLPIAVQWLDVKQGSGAARVARFTIGVDGHALTINQDDGNRVDLDLAIQLTPDAKPSLQAINTKIKPEVVQAIRDSRLTQNGQLELPAGDYNVRFVVRDNASGRIGSVVAPLHID